MMVFLLVNLVLLFNFVIAILSDTYAAYSTIKLGLYNNNLNMIFIDMEWDENYGALLTTKVPIPTFFLAIATTPLYLIFQSVRPDLLPKLNSMVAGVQYLPVSLFVLVIFTLINVSIIPLVYIHRFFTLFLSLFSSKTFGKALINWLYFATIGALILIASIPLNTLKLLVNLYNSNNFYKPNHLKSYYSISLNSLNVFEQVLTSISEEVKAGQVDFEAAKVPATFINKRLQEELKVIQDIVNLMYSNSLDMFTKDNENKTIVNKTNCLLICQDFNVLKNLIFHMMNEDSTFDLPLLQKLVSEMHKKQKFYESNIKHGEAFDRRNEEEIWNDNIYELLAFRGKTITAAFKDPQSQPELETIQADIKDVKACIEKLTELVDKKSK
jgi:hypothetical protein